jgi:hypothetical protein
MKNRKMVLVIALIATAVLLSMCSKKAEAQESGGSSVTGGAKQETIQYNSESDFKADWDKNAKDSVIITEYIGTKETVNIPPSIQNNTVIGIGSNAFADCYNLTSVTIPNGVTTIEARTFLSCPRLASITIPNSVTSIGEHAFTKCTSLASVTIPDSVTSIGERAFQECTSLASVTIPNSVTSIGVEAFNSCDRLTSVTFQGTIAANNLGGVSFNFFHSPFPGDLRDKYLASDGGPGTYKRFAGGNEWRKQ